MRTIVFACCYIGQYTNISCRLYNHKLEFFAFMAHEMRTPFHGVLGSLEAMREDSTLVNNALLNQAYMWYVSLILVPRPLLVLTP